MIVRTLALLPAVLLAGGLIMAAPLPARTETTLPVQNPVAGVLPEVGRLSETLKMGEVVAIMRDEGVDYGVTLEEEMFPGRGGAEWTAAVGAIYDPAEMRARFEARLSEELKDSPDAVAKAIGFFGSAQGQRILTLELEARKALADDAAEEAAKIAVEDMIAENDPRMEFLRQFAETNELIELNVAGALNANLAFYKGLAEGGAFEEEMTEDQMLSDVWSQEADVRAETEAWLFPYLALAYAPLSEDDLAAYQAFSESAEGKRVNHALFAAFDAMFTPISRKMGLAAARQMQGQDI